MSESKPDFVKFARRILDGWPEYGLEMDGAELQDIAVECGLLCPVTMEKPCDEEPGEPGSGACNCANYGTDFPTTCYRKIEALKEKQP